jgi:type IX secretion system PorP/SprF family membrane protein
MCFLTQAQDVHFSQFYAAPLYYNPANAGNFSGSARVGLNYRDQWGSVTVPYRSYDVYADVAIQPAKAVNRFGIGVLAMNDVAGDGILTNTRLQASAAYHIGHTENSPVRFALGISGAYVQKTLDIYKLTFDSQWNVDEFNTGLPNNETAKEKLQYYDFSAGILSTFIPYEDERYFLGVAVHHITQPVESFYETGNTLHTKYVAQAGAFIQAGANMSLQPQAFYTQQSSASEIIAGMNMSLRSQFYDKEKFRALILGAWYRYKDAAWVVAGMNLGNYTCTVNYDFNFSQLTPATQTLGGLEIAMVYTFRRSEKHNPINCPAFE